MNKTHRKILIWLVSFGKIKSGVIFFLLVTAAYFILALLLALLQFLFSKIGYPNLVSDKISFSAPVFLLIVCEPWNFYKKTIITLENLRLLQKKGLTPEDIERIEFIKTWEKTREFGIKKFCFYNGGITAGIILTIPITILLILITGYFKLVSGTGGEIWFVAILDISSGYFLGVFIYYLRWQRNEQKFIRLTDPLH